MSILVQKILFISFLFISNLSLYAIESKPKPLRSPISVGFETIINSKIVLKEENHPAIVKHINRFSRGGMNVFLQESLERARPYLSYIMERIDYYDLPRELIYLPVVESGYRYDAVSRVGAMGMWQFMYASALPYGLVINEWRDDRLDVYLSTDAALRKIKKEMELLGDPLLAIAAYNGGITRVRRHQNNLLRLGKQATFWQMYDANLLPKETSEYVPQLLAIASIMKEPRKYGLKPIKWQPKKLNSGKSKFFIEYELDKQVNLELIAKNTGIDLWELKQLNQSLKRTLTPPATYTSKFTVRLPISYADQLKTAISSS